LSLRSKPPRIFVSLNSLLHQLHAARRVVGLAAITRDYGNAGDLFLPFPPFLRVSRFFSIVLIRVYPCSSAVRFCLSPITRDYGDPFSRPIN
jgi:hypothetical protein